MAASVAMNSTRRFVTFYISALEILLLTYLLTLLEQFSHTAINLHLIRFASLALCTGKGSSSTDVAAISQVATISSLHVPPVAVGGRLPVVECMTHFYFLPDNATDAKMVQKSYCPCNAAFNANLLKVQPST